MRTLCALGLVLFCAPLVSQEDRDQPPNIVLILADDLGYGDLGSYNEASKIPTPNLDFLATQGMRFTDAHSPSGVCTPTRYGVLTGRYAWRTNMTRGVLNGYSRSLIDLKRTTLASMLKKRGYATAAVGKWHLGLGDQQPTDYTRALRPGPNDLGFDFFFGIPASLDMPPYLFVENDRPTVPPTDSVAASAMRRNGGEGFWREGAISPGFRHMDVLPEIAKQALGFIEEQAEGPFFLYFPLAAPHTPWMPTGPFVGKSEAGPYGDFVAQVDDVVGRVMALLDRLQIAENTLLVVTSDNGAHWLPGDITRYGHRANGALRGQKADIWEGGHRVPFLVRWPGKVAPGSTSDETMCHTDLLRTCAAVVGAELAQGDGPDSYDFLPVLLGERLEGPLREATVHHSSRGLFAIRQGRWKLIVGRGSGGFTPPARYDPEPGEPEGQLYDLVDNPTETRNLWSEEPEVVKRLGALLDKYRSEGHSRARK